MQMPPGLSPADFYYLLPEIVLTIGSMVVLPETHADR